MAILEQPLAFEVFQSLKGVVDFYYYKGLLCARSYPQHCRQPGTDLQKKTWTALKESYKNKGLITKHDMEGYRTMSGGSHLTWYDLYKKIFIKGWHVDQCVPAVVYDTKLSIEPPVDLIICFRCKQDVDVQVMVAKRSREAQKPWTWVAVNPDTTPPNCSKRVDLLEYWEDVIECPYTGRGERRCYKVGDAIKPGGAWFTMIVKRSVYESTLWRTGCWWLAF